MPSSFATLSSEIRINAGNTRKPQLGAIWAIGSHFTVGTDPAVVAMPTGSGKTLVAVLIPYLLAANRVLVVVPSRILRNQIARDFHSLQLPKSLGILPKGCPKPTVKRVAKRLVSVNAWDELRAFEVVVGTPNALSPGYMDIPEPPSDLFDLVIVDEAHHAPAATWTRLLEAIPSARKVLLTATPYRRDRREVPGTLVYSYPISMAVRDGIFAPIKYVSAAPINGDRDAGLIAVAAQVLHDERESGLAGQLLVRTDNIEEADRLLASYTQAGIRLGVVHSKRLLHSTKAIEAVKQGQLDGLICVDMLGEGFDLPTLKIAVLHSPHRSLPATLQFAGRIARVPTRPTGPPRVIAIPTSNPRAKTPESELLRLYQDNADWQVLIPELAAGALESEANLREFFTGFTLEGLKTVSIRTLRPPFKAVIFDSRAEPVSVEAGPHLSGIGEIVVHAADAKSQSAIWITQRTYRPEWASTTQLLLIDLQLHVAVYDAAHGFLFIQSQFPSVTEEIRDALCADATPVPPPLLAALLSGDDVADIFNVGISNVAPRAARRAEYTMYAGRQADAAIRPSEARHSALGHASARIRLLEGSATEVRGASMRSASVWSSRRGDLVDFVAWCHQVGDIVRRAPPTPGWQSPVGILSHGFAGPIPQANAIAATWPPEAYQSPTPPRLVYNGEPPADWSILDLELAVAQDPQHPESLILSIQPAGAALPIATFSCFAAERIFFPPPGQPPTQWIIEFTEGWQPSRVPVTQYLAHYPPKILLETGEVVQGQRVASSAPDSLSLPPDMWVQGNWENTDITNEATHIEGGPQTVQEATLSMIRAQWGEDTIVIVDHGTGEIADLIAISSVVYQAHSGRIGLFHCKASASQHPSVRVGDLYDVAGQSLKSYDWPGHPDFFAELTRRLDRGRAALLLGSRERLEALVGKSHRAFRFQVHLVQPGLSIAQASSMKEDRRAALLASAYQWFQESAVDFFIIGS